MIIKKNTMSIFIPYPNDNRRVKCTICNNIVSKTLKDRHKEYHQSDATLKKTETACSLCLTPVSIKGHNYVKHLEGFHGLPSNKAVAMNLRAQSEAQERNKKQQIQERAEQQQMMDDEKIINLLVKKGRPRVKAGLPNETEEERAKRMNRENVMKFRDRKRAEKGITGPKRIIKKQLADGESVEDYDRKLRAEAMKRYRAKLKAKKQE